MTKTICDNFSKGSNITSLCVINQILKVVVVNNIERRDVEWHVTFELEWHVTFELGSQQKLQNQQI